ncbi:MAG: hypothetical protein O7D29_03125 [Gemmatimonadetes bacterium]|nr:hypothetical protein [Gemmatimonadota bacterium]
MTNDVIATDHPLTDSQQQLLSTLLDTILPASADGNMPSGAGMNLLGYLSEQAEEFIPVLVEIVDSFGDVFVSLSQSDRYALVEAFSKAQVELFEGLLFHVYACYYQDVGVLEGIGMAAGPPFPSGNTIEAGDLSLLDPVVRKSRTYRK